MEFRISDWRSAIVDHIDIPPETLLKSAIDLSMTADPTHSDQTCIATGFVDEELYAEPNGGGLRMNLIDIRVGHWPGMSLVDQAVENLRAHSSEGMGIVETQIEDIPGAWLFRDALVLKAGMANVTTGRLRLFKRDTRPNAKVKRIQKLIEVLERGLLRIQNGPGVQDLLQQAEQYTFTKKNQNKHDDGLDGLAMLCFGPCS